MKRISLSDLAKHVGYSPSLISMVLNGKADENGIKPETQEKVLAAAKELNYHRNHFASSLRKGKSNTIGLIVSDISNIFYAKICKSAEDAALAKGYNLISCSTNENKQRELDLIQMLKERQVDGLIISTSQTDKNSINQLKKQKLPFVLIDRDLPKSGTNYVGVNNYQGAFDAVTHFLNTGFERIGILTITPAYISTMIEREKGYRDALKAKNIRYSKKLLKEIPHDNIKDGVAKALQELMIQEVGVRAVFSTNNSITLACLEYMNKKNIRIPQDLALISFDDIETFKFSQPPITAIAQPVDDIGKQAIEILTKNIDSKQNIQQIKLPTQLKIRRSCGIFLTL